MKKIALFLLPFLFLSSCNLDEKIKERKEEKKEEIEFNEQRKKISDAQKNSDIDYMEFNDMFYQEKFTANTSGYNSIILTSEWDIILDKYPDSTKQKLIDKDLFLLKHIQGPDIFWLVCLIKDMEKSNNRH